jgi:hypothetical protein
MPQERKDNASELHRIDSDERSGNMATVKDVRTAGEGSGKLWGGEAGFKS